MNAHARLAEQLESAAPTLLVDASQLLARAHLAHYEEDGPLLAFRRLQELFGVLLLSLAERGTAPMVRHAQRVARDRYSRGYHLPELQGAFNALEVAVWDHLSRELEASEFARAIALLSTVLGAGKDALANAFVAASADRDVRAVRLAKLWHGTDGP
jgi:hypothetical protein